MKKTSRTLLTRTATEVACGYGSLNATSAARRSRPPSMGKAGIRLNTAMITLAWKMATMTRVNGVSLCQIATGSNSTPGSRYIKVNRIRANAMFNAGPAIAIAASLPGSSGMRSIEATPPIGRSTISRTASPNFRAMRLWVSSCMTTQAKRRMYRIVPHNRLCSCEEEAHQTSNGKKARKVQCIRIGMPNAENRCVVPRMAGYLLTRASSSRAVWMYRLR
jgi:hypothetical protein